MAVHDSPKPPPTRVSLTRECLERSREVWFLVSGADKADAVRRGVTGAPFETTPAAHVHGVDRTLWLVDTDAAADLERLMPWASSTSCAVATTLHLDARRRPGRRQRRRRRDAVEGIDAVEEIGIRRLTADEEAALEAVRAGYAAHGIDPADLDSVAAAYDRALEDSGDERLLGRRRGARHRDRRPPGDCRRLPVGRQPPTPSAPTSPWSRPAGACRW